MTFKQNQVDVSHIYGLENSRQMALRSMRDGKMKVRIIDGEEFPPLVKDTPVEMIYPADFPEEEKVSPLLQSIKWRLSNIMIEMEGGTGASVF